MADGTSIIKLGQVISNDDPADMGRIKVRICPDDTIKGKEEVDYATPYLPKMFHVIPEVGELVTVISTTEESHSPRFYTAPAISNPSSMDFQDAIDALKMVNQGASMNNEPGERTDPKTNGALPGKKDVCVIGRNGSRVMFRGKSARLEAGTVLLGADSKSKKNISFNTDNPSYIKLDYGTYSGKPCSTAVIVADKINLITHGHDGSNYDNGRPNLTDPENLVDEKDMEKLIEKAHPLPYGDQLVEILELFRRYIMNHVHPQGNVPPCPGTEGYVDLNTVDFNKILSKGIKID